MGFFGWLLDLFVPIENDEDDELEYEEENEVSYSIRETLITQSEKDFYVGISRAVDLTKYVILPQINLATIIKKEVKGKDKFRQNELYRNIDFVVFERENLRPCLCIEINDSSHNAPKRKYRDMRVKDICEQAKLPLIRFWTSYGVNQPYINKTITSALSEFEKETNKQKSKTRKKG